MLCIRITPRSLSQIHRSVTAIVKTCRFTTPNVTNCVTKKIKFPASLPLTWHIDSVLCQSRAYSSKSSETEPQQEQESDPQNSQPEAEPTEPLRTIYKYRHITTARTVAKVKIFQTAVVCGVVPYLYSGYLGGLVSYGALMSSIGIMVTATFMLYVLSDLIRKIICILKYNSDTGEVHISHLTFWGRRRDVILDLSNIVPISDSAENITDTYIKVNTYDKSESFLIFIKDIPEEEKNEVLRILE
ncbi:transmembrane protein 186-like [Mercenaria mercenaria]|uniref:transmembrane protein 186-like n=1 Tax=Mercenaria mercenaria TaxID=6596 RepID=UPI00234FA09F|nr:transmembrane protein 186-like [Mercenaria mercenaria]XP_053392745.1 transmembrane protein 186-like [Mercenaria mercenaria]